VNRPAKSPAPWIVLLCIGTVVVCASLVDLFNFWTVLGDRGLHADETGTPGWTSPAEVAGIVAGGLGALLGVTALILGVVQLARRASKNSTTDTSPAMLGGDRR